jgi:hypothetical protein
MTPTTQVYPREERVMRYPQAFLEIQAEFARRMTELSSVPYHESLLRNTALYRILGLDWSLDPGHPTWQRFVQELPDEGADFTVAYCVYADRYAQGLIPDYDVSRPHWGCFSYDYDPDTRDVRLHFGNLDTSGFGPLSSCRKEMRLAELRAMFAHIRREHHEAEQVRGGSWLYNRAEYRRLFPPEYGDAAHADCPHLSARAHWGQFLRHGNRMNEDAVTHFLTRVTRLADVADHPTCFPYQTLLTEAPMRLFYAFYGVSGPD